MIQQNYMKLTDSDVYKYVMKILKSDIMLC